MEKYGLNELRAKYLSFFETKGHLRLPSFSLIPQHDPSLLLINAGANIIRFVPALVITESHVDQMIEILEECIED